MQDYKSCPSANVTEQILIKAKVHIQNPFEFKQKHPLWGQRLEKTKSFVTYNTNGLLDICNI